MTNATHHITSKQEAHSCKLVISHGSAARYYLGSPCHQPARTQIRGLSALDGIVVPGKADRCAILDDPALCQGPLELLVFDKQYRRHANDLICHISSSIFPRGSFWQLGDKALIASPELCFVQMASKLSEPNLIELGTNLCAKYYIHPVTGCIRERNPVTTKRNLSRYLERAIDIRGAKKASHALQWVLDNSASPKETQSSILLSLPLKYGGYGFKGITLNHRVNPGRNAHLAEQSFFEIDLCLPAKKVGVEYYGADEHPDAVKDRRRLDALEALGWKMIVIDKQRLYDMDAFEVAALQLAKLAGRRLRRTCGWHERASSLREHLGLSGFSRLAAYSQAQ